MTTDDPTNPAAAHQVHRGSNPLEDRMARRAPGYERDGLAAILLRVQRTALAYLDLQPHDRLLDVGCGTGAAVRTAAHHTPIAIGVDRSPAMVIQARSLAETAPATTFLVAEAERLPFPEASFTAVLCTSVAHYLNDVHPTITEIVRVLTPAGQLVIGDFDHACLDTRPGRARSYGNRQLVVDRTRRMLTPFGYYLIQLAHRPDRDPAPGV